ncbi:WxL protein peptidoglycan domain-containing protein [Microbacterium karelineae]|uniref:WxL protein peptidoglycan domain-containing protein n=1 Tax=Microbacterium karelineae TaxID=2654283 RepID=UPI0012EA652C|nr:DUF916 domain-containing protein [Microbacterium karelineae]
MNPRRRSGIPRRALGGALAGILAFAAALAAAPAVADSDDGSSDGTITWSVRPADGDGADGRAWVEQTLDPGQSATERMAVQNFSDEDVTFQLSTADGYFRDNGRFAMLESGEESTAAGTWIDLPDEVRVAAGETVIVPFTTAVPGDATPGDHAAGVAASILSRSVDESGASVGVESRIGFRVMTRVTGEVTPSAEVVGVDASYDTSWNPLAPGSAVVRFEVENTGNTRLMIAGSLDAGGRSAAFPGEGEVDQELMPGDRRVIAVRVDGVWPLFYVPVGLDVAASVTGEGEGTRVDPVRVDAGVWALPLPQLIVLAGVVLILGSVVWGRIRARRRLQALLAEARAAGRREAGRNEA